MSVRHGGSTSSVVTVNVQAVLVGACAATPTNCKDDQTFTVNVPVGSLIISTPYTSAHQFNLGTLALTPDGTQLTTGQVAFGHIGDGMGVTITDQRSGDVGWTASLVSGPFSDTTSDHINPRNLGFTLVMPQYIAGNALNATTKPVVPFDNAATSPAVAFSDVTTATGLGTSKQFAQAAHGDGTVYVTGNFTLNAPTSTPAGTYTGTVTFTIA